MTQKLSMGDRVYIDSWTGIYNDMTVEVGTVEGFAIMRNQDPTEAVIHATQHSHELAWTLHCGVCLYGNKRRAEYEAQKRLEQRQTGILLHQDQCVEIEGRLYTVHVVRGNAQHPYNSDPIKFIPITQ